MSGLSATASPPISSASTFTAMNQPSSFTYAANAASSSSVWWKPLSSSQAVSASSDDAFSTVTS